MTALPPDYSERAYAAVLGKLIGVYLGRPFEGWTYQRIMRELGTIEDYVHERLNCPLVVTDDDVAEPSRSSARLRITGRAPSSRRARSARPGSIAWLSVARSYGGAETATPQSTRPGSI